MNQFSLVTISCLLAAASAGVIYAPYQASYLLPYASPYAVAYPHWNPLLFGYSSPSLVVLKHHTPEHTAEQEKAKEEEKKQEAALPQTLPTVLQLYPYAIPVAALSPPGLQSKYHVQDEFGQYQYGYTSEQSAKEETKTLDGITRGSYSYIDAEGKPQSVSYVSDALGFRVAATNLPEQVKPAYIPDSPEVAAAKEELFRLQREHIAKVEAAPKEATATV